MAKFYAYFRPQMLKRGHLIRRGRFATNLYLEVQPPRHTVDGRMEGFFAPEVDCGEVPPIEAG